MRSICVVWLVTVLSAACAQLISIDENIHLDDKKSSATDDSIITTTSNDNLRDIPLDDDTSDTNVEANSRAIDTDDDQNDDNNSNNNEDTDNEANPEDDQIPDLSNPSDTTENQGEGDQTTDEIEVDENGNESTQEEVTDGYEEKDPDDNDQDNENGVEGPVVPEMAVSDEDNVGDIIEIEGGSVQGYYLHGDSGIQSYIDISYGTFTGLFKAPTTAVPWNGLHEAKTHQKRCPQIDETGAYGGGLDCLTLSVFVPKDVENAAVLFHIYDGEFHVGSADPIIYGPEYLVTKGIILVLPNYRLGALGFLCMNNNIAPGNAGLKDLTLALEWVQNNIAKFGGNPSKITVSGDGKAAALPGYLALSPMSSPFVSGVIAESGSLLAHWAIDRDPKATALLLTTAIQQNITNELSAEAIVTAAKDINFRPCVETGTDTFMNETPWRILHKDSYQNDIPFIIGSANHAGVQEAMIHTAESLSQLNQDFSEIFPDDLKFRNGEEKDIAEKIKKQYFGDKDIGLTEIEHISLCYTDIHYLGPSIRASRALAKAGAKVYFFEFSFVGEFNRMLGSLATTVRGAARGDLVSYTFTQDGEVPQEESDEEYMVNLITDLWVSFIQTGVPSGQNVEWKVLDSVAEAEEEWLSIDRETQQKKGLHVDRLSLWTEVYNNHFIEKNSAIEIQSNLYWIFTGMFVLGFRKDF